MWQNYKCNFISKENEWIKDEIKNKRFIRIENYRNNIQLFFQWLYKLKSVKLKNIMNISFLLINIIITNLVIFIILFPTIWTYIFNFKSFLQLDKFNFDLFKERYIYYPIIGINNLILK